MKTRNSFVSNSSSASFICYWRCLEPDIDSLEDAVEKLIESYDDETLRLCKSIVSKTQRTKQDGTYKTKYWISMYNDIRDVPEEMKNLITAILLEIGFELIDVAEEAGY